MIGLSALLADAASNFRAIVSSPLLWAVICGVFGLWLLLPPSGQRRRALGTMLAAVALGLLTFLLPPVGDWVQRIVFWLLAATTIIAAVATISAHSPVYSAVWFALSLLTTAGLFLTQGAQFLGAATVVVYAGAILVTFLFVLMLAQPEGHTYYDRMSWSRCAPLFAAVCGVLIVAGVTYVLTHEPEPLVRQVDAESANEVQHERHMAKLGGELFSRHLVSVEVAGTLLLVALVGAIAIAMQSKSSTASAHSAAQTAATEGGGDE